MTEKHNHTLLTERQLELLGRLIAEDNLSERKGRGSQKFFYIDKEYVSATLDEVFGVDNWSRETKKIEFLDTTEQAGKTEKWTNGRKTEVDCMHIAVTVSAIVRVTITVGEHPEQKTFVREGTGVDTNNGPVGEGLAVTSKGDVIATAVKSAESDAFKRACAGLGYIFGNNVSDKGQAKITFDGKPPEPRPQPQDQATRPAGATQGPAQAREAGAQQPASRPAEQPKANGRAEPAEKPKQATGGPGPAETPAARLPAGASVEPPNNATPSRPAVADIGDDKARNMQKKMQGIWTKAGRCASEGDFRNTMEELAKERETCAAITSYAGWYDYTINKLIQRGEDVKTLPPGLMEEMKALKITLDDVR